MSDITTAASIAAGGNIGGAVIGGALSAYGAKKADQSNAESLAKQLAWEREKFETAHQVEMKDLKAAGINPILAANKGATAGSITPMPSEQATGMSKTGELIASGLTEAVNGAMGSAKTISELGKIKQEISSMKTKQELEKAQTGLAEATANKTKQEADKLSYENRLLNTMTPEMRQITELGFRAVEAGTSVVSAIATVKNLGIFKKLPKKQQEIVLEAIEQKR